MGASTLRGLQQISGNAGGAAKVSRTHRPKGMDLQEWQARLREQYARDLALQVKNVGGGQIFSEYAVTNPATKRTYRVVIRGEGPGVNYCSCPDYAVNTLGKCKHVEALLHRLRRRHAGALRRGYRPPFSEVYVRYGAQRQIMFSAGTACPAALEALARQYFKSDGLLKTDAFREFDRFLRKAAELDHQLQVYNDAAALIAEVRDAEHRAARLQERYDLRRVAAWRGLLKVPLYQYQREGALFAARAGRAILADEMGLGKTIEAIAAAEILARECGVERTLIICPASLKSQWSQEIGKFSDRSVLIIEGQTHQRLALYRREAFFKVVNYDVVHRDLGAIAESSPDLVILDEAQRIKNWQTRAAKTVKQIESDHAIVLTGTPLENRLEELHSIVEFVDRHRLGPLFAFKAAHEVCQEGSSRVVGYQDLGKIKKTLAPILLRRTKKEVLDQLPPRMDKNFFVPMTDQQWMPHRENQETVARIVAKWKRYNFLTEADQLRLRIALQTMRMSCDSTYLVDHETKYGTKVDELDTLLGEIFEEPKSKVVIFSQWVRMNELVEEMLERRKWGHVHLHGGVPSSRRKDLTRALREDEHCRVFLSTDAGGVGLNLQAASTVINMDLPWNPAVLEQRIGRVHRLGQERPVRVVNFVSEGTIEHGMLSLLAFKKSVFAGVLDGADDKVMMGDSALNRFMKTVETAASSVPQVLPTPTEKEESSQAVRQPPRAAGGNGKSGNGGAAPRPTSPASAQTIGDLLSQGATLLQGLAQALSGLSAPPGTKDSGESPLRVAVDASSGRPELRIGLPDEATLQRWAGALSGYFSMKPG